MTSSRRALRGLKALTLISAGSLFALTIGCSPSPEEQMQSARQASDEKRFDEAVKLFTQLAQDPNASAQIKYQAGFGTAEVYLAQGALEAQAKELESLINNPSMKDYRDPLSQKLETNYLQRAEVLGVGDSTQLEALYKKAIELNPRSEARKKLSEHYVARGVIELKEQRFDEAEDLFKSASALKSADQVLAKKVKQYISEARYKRYSKSAARLVEAKQEQLNQRGLYELSSQTFSLSVEVMVEGRPKRSEREAYQQRGLAQAEPAMSAAIAALIKEVFAAPAEGPTHPELIKSSAWTVGEVSLSKRSKRIKRDGKRLYVTPLSYSAKISLEQVLRLAFEASEQGSAAEAEAPSAEEPKVEPKTEPKPEPKPAQ